MLGEFRVFGLDCAEEVAILRRELQPAPGVKHLRFDVALGKLSIEYDATQTGPAEFKRLVGRTGMRLEDWSPASDGGSATRPAIRRWLRPAVCGIAILAGMIWQADSVKEFFTAFLAHSHGEHEHTVPFGALACFGLAILIGVWQVAPKAFAALRMRRADMNLLVLLSMCGAVFLGEWSEGAMLAFLFSLAGMLEGWSISRAQRALAQAGRQSASRVCVIHQHGD